MLVVWLRETHSWCPRRPAGEYGRMLYGRCGWWLSANATKRVLATTGDTRLHSCTSVRGCSELSSTEQNRSSS